MDNMVKVLCIIQARLTSERLPNKVLLPLGNTGISLLEHTYQRLQKAHCIDEVVFAIPDSSSNEPLARYLKEKAIPFFAGSEDDVLERFWRTAKEYNPRFIVRATCDNPLVDWKLADALVEQLGDYDCISCEDTPLGTAVEVFTMEALDEAYNNVKEPSWREHVTPYIWEKKKCKLIKWSDLRFRLTVDETRDFELVSTIYNDLYEGEPIPNSEVYHYLINNPSLASSNLQVHQKTVGE